MTCISIRVRQFSFSLLAALGISGGSVPSYSQPQTDSEGFLYLAGLGTRTFGASHIVARCKGTERSYDVYYNEREVWAIPGDRPILLDVLVAPRGVDIRSMSLKYNGSDILVELLDGTFFYVKYDSLYCGWNVSRVVKISVNGSATPDEVVGDALYALSTADVQVSRDSGRTWLEDTTGLGGESLTDVALDSLQNVYGVSPFHMYRQAPDSLAWRKLSSYPNLPGSSVASVFVDRRNRIFVGAKANGIYASTDNGNTWNPDTTGMGKQQVLKLGGDAFGNIYAPVGNRLFRSPGVFQPWTRIDAGLTALTGMDVQISAVGGDSTLIAATNFGVFNSTDQGLSWTDRSAQLPVDNVTGILRLSSGRLLLGAPRGIYYLNATDTVWKKSYPSGVFRSDLPLRGDGSGNAYTIDASFPGTVSGYGYPLKSTDGGLTWNLDTAGVSALFTGGILSGQYYVDELGGQYASLSPGTSSWFPYSKPGGKSWKVDTAGMGINPSASDGQSGFVGDGNGSVYCFDFNNGMFRRSITGEVWMHDTAGLGSAVVTRLCRGLNGDIYGSAYGGSYYRRSGGIWTKLNSPQGISIGFTPAISVDGSGTFFAAVNKGFSSMGGGVYATKDNGGHWLKVGLDSLMISQMESFGDSTFVLTINRGVNIINSNNLTGVQSSFQRPLAFVLSQNYPNPFNPTTTIRFELPKSLHVSLKVYDILGQEVSVLVNENRSAGVYEMRFDGTNLASGVYFYRLTAGAFVETRKLLLLR